MSFSSPATGRTLVGFMAALLCSAVLGASSAGATCGIVCQPLRPPPPPPCGPGADQTSNGPAAVAATICLINNERAARLASQLRPLSANAQLDAGALAHSLDAVARPQSDPHAGSDGSTPPSRFPGWHIVEDMYSGSGPPLDTPRAAVAWWMNSPRHRANILDQQATDIGIGIAPGTPTGATGHIYTVDFGWR
jgi:uncharacterized protein YkwD